MGRDGVNASVLLEVEKLPRPGDQPGKGVKKVHHPRHLPPESLDEAKRRVGAAVHAAIGDTPRKVYGAENVISGVVSGDKVPDYLARIYQDHGARRRLAKALLNGASGVRSRHVTVIEWDEEEAV